MRNEYPTNECISFKPKSLKILGGKNTIKVSHSPLKIVSESVRRIGRMRLWSNRNFNGVCVCACACACAYARVYICECVYVYICECVYLYMCLSECVYVCVCQCVLYMCLCV